MPDGSASRLPGAIECAACGANWNARLLRQFQEARCLRASGFAYIELSERELLINCCPHCELPVMHREEGLCLFPLL